MKYKKIEYQNRGEIIHSQTGVSLSCFTKRTRQLFILHIIIKNMQIIFICIYPVHVKLTKQKMLTPFVHLASPLVCFVAKERLWLLIDFDHGTLKVKKSRKSWQVWDKMVSTIRAYASPKTGTDPGVLIYWHAQRVASVPWKLLFIRSKSCSVSSS